MKVVDWCLILLSLPYISGNNSEVKGEFPIGWLSDQLTPTFSLVSGRNCCADGALPTNGKYSGKNVSMNAMHIFIVLFIFKMVPLFQKILYYKILLLLLSVCFWFATKKFSHVHLWVLICIHNIHQVPQSHTLLLDCYFFEQVRTDVCAYKPHSSSQTELLAL